MTLTARRDRVPTAGPQAQTAGWIRAALLQLQRGALQPESQAPRQRCAPGSKEVLQPACSAAVSLLVRRAALPRRTLIPRAGGRHAAVPAAGSVRLVAVRVDQRLVSHLLWRLVGLEPKGRPSTFARVIFTKAGAAMHGCAGLRGR